MNASLTLFLNLNCTPTSSVLTLPALPILIQRLSKGAYIGFITYLRTGNANGRASKKPIACVKFVKKVRRLTLRSNSGTGTNTSPGSTCR